VTWAHMHRMGKSGDHEFPALANVPDVNRGEQRLAAEVAIARLCGRPVSEAAVAKGLTLLERLASR
jgi:hypothetical protein